MNINKETTLYGIHEEARQNLNDQNKHRAKTVLGLISRMEPDGEFLTEREHGASIRKWERIVKKYEQEEGDKGNEEGSTEEGSTEEESRDISGLIF